MPSKLKNFFDEKVIRGIARDLRKAYPRFDAEAFAAECLDGLARLELMARGWHIAEAMRRHLPEDFAAAAEILVAGSGPEPTQTELAGMAPFRYLPHVLFVARYGRDCFEASMRAQYELTKRFTAEYSIRTFLEAHPRATYRRLEQWARDGNVHVRRLVSEGTRPRLPWAPRLRAFQDDPAPVIRLLEILKDDPELYVRRSVANSLNDIGKDHPDVLVDVCRRWSADAGPERAWIIRHALRSLVKRGDRGALAILGYAAAPRVAIEQVTLAPRRVPLGGALAFSFELVGTSRRRQDLLVDYAVHFVKASGETRPKVFKLKKLALPAKGRVRLADTVSFAPMTTRRHYPGLHRIEVLVNGVAHPLGEFDVRA